MNKWFRRTVGTVGIAGGIWLLGAGAAHADDSAVKDPQQLNGLFDEILTPAGGPNNLGLSLDAPDRKVSTGLVPGGPVATGPHTHRGQAGLTVHTPRRSGLPNDPFVTAPIPDVMRSLPITDATGTTGLRGLAPGTESALDTGAARLPLVETILGSLPVPGADQALAATRPAASQPAALAGRPSAVAGRAAAVAGQPTAVTGQHVPSSGTGAVHSLPDGPNSLGDDLVDQSTEAQSTEALPLVGGGGLPLVGGLPVVGGLTRGGLPVVGGLTGGGLPVVGGLTGGGLPLAGGGLPVVGELAGAGPSRAAERPVAAGESMEGGLPIFDGVAGGVAGGTLADPATGGLGDATGGTVAGRHRADTSAGQRSLPDFRDTDVDTPAAIDAAGFGPAHVNPARFDPSDASDLPIFTELLRS